MLRRPYHQSAPGDIITLSHETHSQRVLLVYSRQLVPALHLMLLTPETRRQQAIYGLNRQLYQWLVARAARQRTTVGALINHLIHRYRAELLASTYRPPRLSPYPPQRRHRCNVPGIDRTLWQWFTAHAKLQDRRYGHILNELIEHYRNEEPWSLDRSPYPPYNQPHPLPSPALGGAFPLAPEREHLPPLPSLTIKGIDPDLRRWLKIRASFEGRRIGILLNEIIERYKDQVGWSEANAARVPNPHPSISVRGLNPQLWQWVKDRAAHENKVAGDVINDLLRQYRKDVSEGEARLPISPPVSDPDYIVSIKGIDRYLWQDLKDGAVLERKTIGESLNEIIEWYRRTVDWP